jgi:predicted GIY-YIG superfamily endonuclease
MTSVHDDRRLHDIYRMRDLSGRLLYIGVTNGGLRRFMEHSKDKTWWREVTQIDVEHVHCSRSIIESIEREAIRTERPLYNVTHNTGRTLPPPVTTKVTTPAPLADVPHVMYHSHVGLVEALSAIGVDGGLSVRETRQLAERNGIFTTNRLIARALVEIRDGNAELSRPRTPLGGWRRQEPSDPYGFLTPSGGEG